MSIKTIKQIIKSYSSDKELEVKFYIDPRVPKPANYKANYKTEFVNVLDGILSNLGKCVDKYQIIDLGQKEIRRRIVFRGDSRSEAVVEKQVETSVTENNDFGGYKVTLATERPSDKKVDNPDRIVIKSRYVYRAGDWNVEVSGVKRATIDSIIELKSKMINQDLLDTGLIKNFYKYDFIEFEMEYAGTDQPRIDMYNLYATFVFWTDIHLIRYVSDLSYQLDKPYKLPRFDRKNGMSKLLPKAVELPLEKWQKEIKLSGMIIRDKIDGERQLVTIDKDGVTILTASKIVKKDCPVSEKRFVFDTEYYGGRWYILHPLVVNGDNVCGLCDSKRLELLKKLPVLNELDITVCPYTVDDPVAWWARKTEYERDGVLFSTDEPYWIQKTYKWKPAETSTIDFLALKCPDTLLGKYPYVPADGCVVYILLVGCNVSNPYYRSVPNELQRLVHCSGDYRAVPFIPQQDQYAFIWNYSGKEDLHGKIVELAWHNDSFDLYKIRTDRVSIVENGDAYGNDVCTALDIWSKFNNPFGIEDITREWKEPEYDSVLADRVSEWVSDCNYPTIIFHCTGSVPIKERPESAQILYAGRNEQTSLPKWIKAARYKEDWNLYLPKQFIGGANLLVRRDPAFKEDPVKWLKKINPLVRYSGKLVVLGTERFSHGFEECYKKLGYVLLKDDEYRVLRKDNRGGSTMTFDEVKSENPHLKDCEAPNFDFKFMRQKTKDIGPLTTKPVPCGSLCVDRLRGESLAVVEFLAGLEPGTQVSMYGYDHLKSMFTDLVFLDDNDKQNVEALVSTGDYDTGVDRIKEKNPYRSLIRFGMQPGGVSQRVVKGKMYFVPYQHQSSSSVFLVVDKLEHWNIIPDMFIKEMETFQYVYRASAFKLTALPDGYDNCYDCRSEIYIINKYCKRYGKDYKSVLGMLNKALA